MSKPKILVLSTGGTILQKEVSGRMEVVVPVEAIAREIAVEAEVDFREVTRVSGAEMNFAVLLQLRDVIAAARADGVAGVVLTTGTDSLEEMAFALDLMLPPLGPVVITGAMKPTSALGYDGAANLADALQVALSEEARSIGVTVVMSGVVHAAQHLRKQDSALFSAFQSHPGSIADIRRGRPCYYYTMLPQPQRYLLVDEVRLTRLKVIVWTMVVQAFLPEQILDGVDGLVVAGMGTGSLSQEIISKLSSTWTSRVPVVLTTRCLTGGNYDDHLYKGSLQKYESHGFRLAGYEGLNALQARIKLMLEIASGSVAATTALTT